MILQTPPLTNTGGTQSRTDAAAPALSLLLALLLGLFTAASCDERAIGVDPDTRLCNGEGAIGLDVTGRAEPTEFCAEDGEVSALFTAESRYDVAARMVTDDVVYEIQMVFAHRDDFPVALHPTADLGEATGDPLGVWIYYQEIPSSGEALESTAVTGGSFTLSFSGGDVAAGTMKKIALEMRTQSSGDPAGTRVIDEGFFAFSTEP